MTDPSILLQLLFFALSIGAIISMMATGVTLLFGTVRILNLAYGDVYALSSVLVTVIITKLNLQPDSPPATLLGGLLLEQTTKYKDKVPFLGDLPMVGRLFRSEATQSKKTSLMIFVTPTIIDPAGNRVHTDEDLPFAQSGIPSQAKTTTP